MKKNRGSLKIAQVAPISERIPPKKYGGTERVVYALTEELKRLGHKVTLFASGDSKTSAKLSSIYSKSLRDAKISDPYGLNEWTLVHIGAAYKRQKEFDIIHDHNHLFGIPMAHFSKTPTVITMHGPILPRNRKLFEVFNKPSLITISKSQRKNFSNFNILDTIYNGLPMESYPINLKHDGYLLYVGRVSMEKGLHHAIEVAKVLNLPLIIAAKLDPVEEKYFNQYVKPKLNNPKIKWVGEVDEKRRNNLMSKAICLLHPVTWPEPFGLAMIEAMACGCPVIAFNHGSVPEVIKNGKTGFIVKNKSEMIRAVNKIDKIKRIDCRNYSLENFNEKIMTQKYLNVYYKLLKNLS